MNDVPLAIKVNCKDNEKCLFDKEDIFLEINIQNVGSSDVVGFPLEYVKHKGPIVKLTDVRTNAETYVPTHIADWDLKENLTQIKPGESATMEWVITATELRQFGAEVDVTAEVTIMAEVFIKGKKLDFQGSHSVRIVSKDKPKDAA